MARVAFFTEKLPPSVDPIADFSYDLILNLADQGHDICVYTTFRAGDQLPRAHPRVQILRPFQRWSWLEVPGLVPLLLGFQPDIIHIVQPRHEALKGFTNALIALPAIAKFIGRPSFVTSFYDLHANALGQHKFVLFSSDAVTVSNHSQASLMQDWLRTLDRNAPIAVLPLPSMNNETTPPEETLEPIPESLQNFVSRSEQMIFVPGDLFEHEDRKALFGLLAKALQVFTDSQVVFGGGWGQISAVERIQLMREFETGNLGGRVLFTGPLSFAAELYCLKNARAVFTATLHPESMRLIKTVRLGLKVSAVLIIGAQHQALDPIGLRDREHALVVGRQPESWGPVLAQVLESTDLAETIRTRIPDFARIQTTDQPGNVVSRIYAQLIGSKLTR